MSNLVKTVAVFTAAFSLLVAGCVAGAITGSILVYLAGIASGFGLLAFADRIIDGHF